MKNRIPPPFTPERARLAQRASVRSRRLTDIRLRQQLAAKIGTLPFSLRLRMASGLGIRLVEDLLSAGVES